MLLDELSLEEKKAFWNIANALASVDGRVMEEESILQQYNEEMGVNFAFIDASLVNVSKELDSIKSGSLRSRKIVYFELNEHKILDEAANVLGIEADVREILETSVKNIFDTYKKLGEVLDG